MKAKTLCAAVLSTLILGGTVASAAPGDPMTTNGNVHVEDGWVDPTPGVTDPEKPDEKLPELPDVKPNPNPDMGPLEISHAPVLQFGRVQTATTEVSAFAAANKFKNAADEEQSRGALLQFGDLRTDANGYTVNAKMTKQFTQTPGFEATVKLEFDQSALVATAGNADKAGKGMWTVEYGSSTNVNAEDTTANSVKLLIPAYTASSMAGGDYQADIEWSITAAP